MSLSKFDMKQLDVSFEDLFDTDIKLDGWVRRTRVGGSGKLVFIDIYDGTMMGSVKCIVEEDTYKSGPVEGEEFKTLSYEEVKESSILSDGCSVKIEGTLVKSPEKASQDFEIKITKLKLVGGVEDAQTYPIQKSNQKSHPQSLNKDSFTQAPVLFARSLEYENAQGGEGQKRQLDST